jgi:hypothetical protein
MIVASSTYYTISIYLVTLATGGPTPHSSVASTKQLYICVEDLQLHDMVIMLDTKQFHEGRSNLRARKMVHSNLLCGIYSGAVEELKK